jgi:hypothetical protein
VLMAAIVGPQILSVSKVIDIRFNRYHFLQVLDPVYTALYISTHSDRTVSILLWGLVALTTLAVMINILAMFQGVMRVLHSRVRPRKPSDITPYSD